MGPWPGEHGGCGGWQNTQGTRAAKSRGDHHFLTSEASPENPSMNSFQALQGLPPGQDCSYPACTKHWQDLGFPYWSPGLPALLNRALPLAGFAHVLWVSWVFSFVNPNPGQLGALPPLGPDLLLVLTPGHCGSCVLLAPDSRHVWTPTGFVALWGLGFVLASVSGPKTRG